MSRNVRLNSIKDVAGRLRLSRSTVYQELDSGRLKSVTVGRRRLVTESQLIEYIDNLIETGKPDGGRGVPLDAVVEADVVQSGAAVVRA